jgi:hypothetical protein
MAQSFGFWRIALSSFVAVLMFFYDSACNIILQGWILTCVNWGHKLGLNWGQIPIVSKGPSGSFVVCAP